MKLFEDLAVIERPQEAVAAELGYELSGHRLELYAVKTEDPGEEEVAPA